MVSNVESAALIIHAALREGEVNKVKNAVEFHALWVVERLSRQPVSTAWDPMRLAAILEEIRPEKSEFEARLFEFQGQLPKSFSGACHALTWL
jgi:hypothetical protein